MKMILIENKEEGVFAEKYQIYKWCTVMCVCLCFGCLCMLVEIIKYTEERGKGHEK